MELATLMTGVGEGVRSGRVVERPSNGTVPVQLEGEEFQRHAWIVKTSDSTALTLDVGDEVLVAVDSTNDRAFVLGLIESCSSGLDVNYPPDDEQQLNVDSIESKQQSDVVRVEGQKIHISAGEEVRITCGDGLILIDKNGKVVVRGSNVVSRARGSNKIKGASVAIN